MNITVFMLISFRAGHDIGLVAYLVKEQSHDKYMCKRVNLVLATTASS